MTKDAKTRATEVLTDLYPDPAVRQVAVEGLGEAGLVKLGESVLRQDDYSRSMAEVKTRETEYTTLYGQNKQWFADRQKDLEELAAFRAKVTGGGGGRTADDDPPTPEVVTKEELTKRFDATERGAVAFIRDLTRLQMEHYQRFNEILDTDRLLSDPRAQQIGILGVYNEVHKDRLAELATKAQAAAEQKIRDDERKKVLAERGALAHPYPVRGNEPSALDAIEQARTGQAPQVRTVDQMAEEYGRLQAARLTGSTV